jgi:beta-N-acetylhexosaminidase
VTLEEKIGQMLMIGFRGFSVTTGDGVFADIAEGRVGSTVLFDFDVPSGTTRRNIESPSQVLKLTRDLQSLSSRRVLIAADQEGGIVARLKPSNGFPATFSAQELGDRDDLQATRRAAGEMAATLAQYGINLNLAPVVDVNVNPDNPVIGGIERSFSADPEKVAEQAIAFIDAHHEHGVLTTLKHFPGHGSSEADSHLGFVDVTGTWSDRELIPYREIISAKRADAIMTAHIFNSTLDPEFPATLSKRTITDVLREQLGYDGVIITDDMMMGAIANFYNFEDAVVAAVEAGADIVAVANNSPAYVPDISARTYNALVRAAMTGRLSESRIDESYRRIMDLKGRLS